jgi:hypothetical protein
MPFVSTGFSLKRYYEATYLLNVNAAISLISVPVGPQGSLLVAIGGYRISDL